MRVHLLTDCPRMLLHVNRAHPIIVMNSEVTHPSLAETEVDPTWATSERVQPM